MTVYDRLPIAGIYPPGEYRVRFVDQIDETDYAEFWRGLRYGLLIVAPVWLLVFALVWVRWGF